MFENMILGLEFLYLVMVFLYQASNSEVIVGPKNTVGLIGTSISLSCTIQGDIYPDEDNSGNADSSGYDVHGPGNTYSDHQQWKVTNSRMNSKIIAVDESVRGDYKNMYNVVGDPKNYELTLMSASYENAGTHTCVDGFDLDYMDAEIIVLESNPICTTNSTAVIMEGQYIYFVCNVRYQGKLSPRMKLDIDERHLIEEDKQNKDMSNPKLVRYSFTINGTSDMDGKSLRVETYFDEPQSVRLSQSDAANVPDYTHIWHSNKLNIHYSPRNIVITHCAMQECKQLDDGMSDITLHLGDSLDASSIAKPNVDHFTWKNGSDIIAEGPEKDTLVLQTQGYATVTCIVVNTMEGGVRGTQTRKINVLALPADSDLRPGHVSGIVIGSFVAGTVVPTIIFIVLFVRMKRKKVNTQQEIRVPEQTLASISHINKVQESKAESGEYEHITLNPNTRRGQPETIVYAQLTRPEIIYEQV